jgi:hypothetical protein
LEGRCQICLGDFIKEGAEDVTFLDRKDLIRIDSCYHRFHLLCVYRDWFRERHVEKDEFGGDLITKVPEVKRCAICRSVADDTDVDLVKEMYASNKQIEDNSYG